MKVRIGIAVGQWPTKATSFDAIVELIDHCLQVHSVQEHLTLDELLAIDAWARQQVADRLTKNKTVHQTNI